MSDAPRAVFLSYASQDADAAKRICDALRQTGVEVWFDQSELRGGDSWDAKIRKQIKECALFVPIISANTNARAEGYFRLEWKLAVDRSHLMADDAHFLFPVVIDETRDATARVPDKFRDVQWVRLNVKDTPETLAAQVGKLLNGGLEAGRPRPAERGSAFAKATADKEGAVFPKKEKPAWFKYTMAIGGMVIGLAYAFRGTWQPPRRAEPATLPSAARELATKSRALLAAGRVVSRETLAAADDLAEQALKLAPTDAEVVATAAQVDAFMVHRGFDISERRRQAAFKQAQRALALDSGSFEARHARAVVAGFLAGSSDMLAESEHIYWELLKERPAEDVLGQELGRVLQNENRFADAAAIFLQAKQPLDAGWAYFIGGQFQEADKVADRLLAEKRDPLAFVLKANVELFGFGDMAAAQAAVGHLTPTELMNDDAAGIALRLAVLQRDAPRILKLLGAFANPFVSIESVNYPTQYWTGYAQMMLAHPEAARSEWHSALQAVEERLKSNSTDAESLGWVATLQALLGEKEAAEQALRLYLNYNPVAPGRWDWFEGLTRLHLGGRNDEVLDRLAGELRQPHPSRTLYLFARSCPEFDALRGDPRFETLLRETLPAGMKPFTATTDQPAAPKVDEKSVAVLAFANLSDDKGNEYFSDGISEELLNVLAKIPGLKVSARTSAFYFKGKEVPIPEIAKQLGVAYVVEGSVRKQGDKVRITAQLIKAADGFQVWSDDFDRDLKDIFAVQDEIAGLIAKNLQIKLGTGDLIGSGTTNPEVLRLYLEGRQAWNLRSEAGYDRAEALLNRALELDPRFARAYAALADVWRIRYSQVRMGGGLANRNSPELAKILAKINEALALDPNCAEAYTSLGAVRGDNWEIEEAIRDLRRAIALNPNYATAHQWLANQLLSLGFVDEAIAEDRLAVELDPLSHRILDNLCWDLTCAGRYREAWDTLERARVLRPNGTQIACYRVTLLLQQGKRTEALAEARRLLTPERGADDPPFARYVAMSVLVADGRRAEAEALLPQFPPTGDDRVLALVYLGRMPEALTLLDTVTPGFIQYVLYGTPLREFDPVRNDPVLQAWLAKAGLTEAHARAQAWRAAHPPEKSEAKP